MIGSETPGAMLFDATPCDLGEGPLWHPVREQFYWFDINAHRLYTKQHGATRMWQFQEYVSAAAWVDADKLLIGSETALSVFDLETGSTERLCPLEADLPLTRSNDGRADPQGGFWIGTMGKQMQPELGSIWRYYRGEVRLLYPKITISNAICFAPVGDLAYFADTPTGKVWRQQLDSAGWPKGDPEVFLDLPAARYRPDGAVIDAGGDLWIAQYGHGRVVRFDVQGKVVQEIVVPGKNTTCPAFGAGGLDRLLVTTARQKLSDPSVADGQTFLVNPGVVGQAEHQVLL